jgi:hypothetical protein
MKSSGMFERVGRHVPGVMAGGAFLVEATKLVYPPKGKTKTARRSIGVLEGVTAPTAKPV